MHQWSVLDLAAFSFNLTFMHHLQYVTGAAMASGRTSDSNVGEEPQFPAAETVRGGGIVVGN